MKNIWLTALLIVPLVLRASPEESSMTLSQAAKKVFGATLRTGTRAARAVKKADGADVTVYSFPLWFAHGLHGYKQRWDETHVWNTEKFGYDPKANAAKYPYFWNRMAAGDVLRFSWLHPIQTLKGNVRKFPPLFGAAVASVATGFSWHATTNYSQWYAKKYGK